MAGKGNTKLKLLYIKDYLERHSDELHPVGGEELLGMLAEKMTPDAMDELLTTRYIDDWGYQANIRAIVARQLGWFRAAGAYSSLDEKKRAAEMRATQFMRRFVEENLPPIPDMQYVEVHFPWNRMFEAQYSIEPPFDLKAYMEEKRAE